MNTVEQLDAINAAMIEWMQAGDYETFQDRSGLFSSAPVSTTPPPADESDHISFAE